MNQLRRRPLQIGPLRSFEAVARRLAFGAAAEELHLSQPAVSRQIRALEEELGTPLFARGTRHVELTTAGASLQRTVAPLLGKLDATVAQIRSARTRQHVSVATFASLASLWLLPRLARFQGAHPGIDIRISAGDALVSADDPEIDLALRYCLPGDAPSGSVPLFEELLTPVASPALLERLPLKLPADLARHTLLEEDDHRPSAEYLSWRRWLASHAPPGLEPRGWIYLNYTHQQIQAALAGQGIALARWCMVGEAIERGELVEPFGATGRTGSPFGYWLVRWPTRRQQPEVRAFDDWLLEEADATQGSIARVRDTAGPVR
jgi:LysR family transcriptional regulator, glycine cleavage system transcriptional activator